MRLRAHWAGSFPASTASASPSWSSWNRRKSQEFAAYKRAHRSRRADSTSGKLLPGGDLANAYTPSFNLLGHESLIMEQATIGAISDSIKDCLRCGKCKPVCATHVPRANLLYQPAQQDPRHLAADRGVPVRGADPARRFASTHWDEFSDVADHCTVCHKCVKPCPVDIDFGDVSIAMRDLLRRRARSNSIPAPLAAMLFLNATNPATIRRCAKLMIDWGYRAQRLGYQLAKRSRPRRGADAASAGHDRQAADRGSRSIHFINKPHAGRHAEAHLARLLGHRGPDTVPIIRDPREAAAKIPRPCSIFRAAVRSACSRQVGLATQAMLWTSAADPCCRPAICAAAIRRPRRGDEDKGQKIITDNRVLFHRVANTLNYLDIKTVIVSCGTCMDQLQGYQFDKIFPGCRMLDIHEYLMEKGVRLEGVHGPALSLP